MEVSITFGELEKFVLPHIKDLELLDIRFSKSRHAKAAKTDVAMILILADHEENEAYKTMMKNARLRKDDEEKAEEKAAPEAEK